MRGPLHSLGMLAVAVLVVLGAAGVLNILTPLATGGAYDPTYLQCISWLGLLSIAGWFLNSSKSGKS